VPFRDDDALTLTDAGLYCPAGGFHIDPWKPVDMAVTTHAHADHVGFGSASFLTSRSGEGLLRARVGDEGGSIETLNFGERRRVGDAVVSLHPAGHVLGSAQVRLEPAGSARFPVTVVTGDYRPNPAGERDAQANPTAEPFECVACEVFISESTFGLPIYRWPSAREAAEELNRWWADNAASGRTTVVFAYALGKAQRVLAMLDPSIGPIGMHGSVEKITEAYRAAGVALPEAVHANAETAKGLKGTGVIVAPGSADNTPWLRRFRGRGGLRTAFVSGWMRVRGKRRWRAADRGFVVSDHADWPGLLGAIRESGAARVGVTHGFTGPLSRYLREELGLDSFVVPTRFEGEGGEDDTAARDSAEREPGHAADLATEGEHASAGPEGRGG